MLIPMRTLLLLLGSALFASSCQTSEERAVVVPSDVDLVVHKNDEIAENPSNFVGKKVFIQGKIQELLSDNAFLLDYDGFPGLSRILVLEPRPYAEARIAKNKSVEVTGEVVLFNRDEMERRLGRSLSPTLFDRYQNQPVIMVTSLLSH